MDTLIGLNDEGLATAVKTNNDGAIEVAGSATNDAVLAPTNVLLPDGGAVLAYTTAKTLDVALPDSYSQNSDYLLMVNNPSFVSDIVIESYIKDTDPAGVTQYHLIDSLTQAKRTGSIATPTLPSGVAKKITGLLAGTGLHLKIKNTTQLTAAQTQTVTGAALTEGTIQFKVTNPAGVLDYVRRQSITPTGKAMLLGTFKLNIVGTDGATHTSAAIDFDATTGELQTAINALVKAAGYAKGTNEAGDITSTVSADLTTKDTPSLVSWCEAAGVSTLGSTKIPLMTVSDITDQSQTITVPGLGSGIFRFGIVSKVTGETVYVRKQTITPTDLGSGETFKLSIPDTSGNMHYTASLAYNIGTTAIGTAVTKLLAAAGYAKSGGGAITATAAGTMPTSMTISFTDPGTTVIPFIHGEAVSFGASEPTFVTTWEYDDVAYNANVATIALAMNRLLNIAGYTVNDDGTTAITIANNSVSATFVDAGAKTVLFPDCGSCVVPVFSVTDSAEGAYTSAKCTLPITQSVDAVAFGASRADLGLAINRLLDVAGYTKNMSNALADAITITSTGVATKFDDAGGSSVITFPDCGTAIVPLLSVVAATAKTAAQSAIGAIAVTIGIRKL